MCGVIGFTNGSKKENVQQTHAEIQPLVQKNRVFPFLVAIVSIAFLACFAEKYLKPVLLKLIRNGAAHRPYNFKNEESASS